MKIGRMFCAVIFASFLGGCTSDLVSPPYEDHPNLKAAEIARARGDVPQAIKSYRDIITECPGCMKAYLGLGMALIDANALVEAKQAFDKAIALFPKSSGAFTGLGLVYLLIDQPENAINAFDNALKYNPRNARAFNGYGIALDMINDHEVAQANYRAAMELEPTNISFESNLALSMALAGNESEAIRILERLVRCPNVTPRIRQNLALAYGLAGDIRQAKNVGRVDLPDDMVMNNVTYFEVIQQTRQYSGLIPKDNTTSLNETRVWQGRN